MNKKNEIVIRTSLGLMEEDFRKMVQLTDIIDEKENLHQKINLDMLATRRSSEKNDFLAFHEEELVGFFSLYDIGGTGETVELTGMVHPKYRGLGIFHQLHEEAMVELKSRGVKRVLYVVDRGSEPGKAFASQSGGLYLFSEYRMEANVDVAVNTPLNPLRDIAAFRLEKGTEGNLQALREIDLECFGRESVGESSRMYFGDGRRTYLAYGKVKGPEETGVGEESLIGKIGLTMEGNDGYICGVAVPSTYRGRGCGGRMLQGIIEILHKEGVKKALLEVESENENALSLYLNRGFKKITAYDYYERILSHGNVEK